MSAIIAGRTMTELAPLGVMRSEFLKRAEMSPAAPPPSPAAAIRAQWAMIDARSVFSVVAMSLRFLLSSGARNAF